MHKKCIKSAGCSFRIQCKFSIDYRKVFLIFLDLSKEETKRGVHMVTIKELSDSIGVSKVGITKWIERNGYKGQLQKVGNKFYVPADVEQKIRANFDRREAKREKAVNTITDAENTVTSEIIALLREQLEVKDKEIERLHTQVENLQRINADTIKALRESNTLQAMQLTDGSDRSGHEAVEDLQRTASEPRENTDRNENVAREKNSLINRFFRLFR